MGGIVVPKKKKLTMKGEILNFNKPNYVYIPLIVYGDTDITILVKKDDYVCKGTEIGRKKGDLKLPIYSSISGKVVDFEEHTHISGKKVRCIVIENDFKEKMKPIKPLKTKLNEYTKEEFIETIKNAGIVGLSGTGFPTYAKYDTETKIETLVINAVECEPYATSDTMFIKDKCEEILETIDAIMTINNIEKTIIAVKKSNNVLISALEDYLGSYLRIKLVLVPNLYPLGWEKMLIKETLGITYDKLPIEKGIVVNNISTIYAIYEALKLGKPYIERVVTFSGEEIKKPKNVLLKNGTKIMDVIEELGYVKKNKPLLIAGGPMMGVNINEDLISSPELDCVLLLKELEEEKNECIRCGKCIDACPNNLCPVLIKDNIENKEKLLKLNPNKCIECGLCSFVCPSKINIREFVKQAKEIINGDENV